MRKRFFSIFILLYCICLTNQVTFGQTVTVNSGLSKVQPDNAGEAKVYQILTDAGIYFKQGLLNLEDNRRSEARRDFDKSVEVFLLSNVNVKSNAKLTNCYNQLIETVYRMEFPSVQQSQIKGLATTCGWNIDNKLADNVAKLSQILPKGSTNTSTDTSLVTSVVSGGNQTDVLQQVGFSDQKFEPSPLEELSKLDLSTENYLKFNLSNSKDQKEAITNKNCRTQSSPSIRNIKLGMSKLEVENALKTKISLQKIELSDVGVTFATVSKTSGVYQLYLNFLDGQLFWIKVTYDRSIKWSSIYEFRQKISEALALPYGWESLNNNETKLVCNSFQLKITELFSYSDRKTYMLEASSIKADEVVRNRLRQKESERLKNLQKKKDTFKP